MVHRDVRQRLRHRAGGDDDVLGLEDLLAAALVRVTSTLPLPAMRPWPFTTGDLVLLHQEVDAVGALGDDLVLVLLRLGPVDRRGLRDRCRTRPPRGCGGRARRSRAATWWGCSRGEDRCRPAACPSRRSPSSSPSCPARIAATYPPGPEPMITTSNVSATVVHPPCTGWVRGGINPPFPPDQAPTVMATMRPLLTTPPTRSGGPRRVSAAHAAPDGPGAARSSRRFWWITHRPTAAAAAGRSPIRGCRTPPIPVRPMPSGGAALMEVARSSAAG